MAGSIRGLMGKMAVERLAVVVALFVTLGFELLLAERKYGLFGGGFGQSRALDGAGEVALFLACALAAQALYVALAYLLIFVLMNGRTRRLTRLMTFLFVTCGVAIAVAMAKFELLSYFSDAVSFQLLANLGGGSLVDAALFGLSEGALIAQILGGAILAWLVCLLLIRRFTPATDRIAAAALEWRTLLVLAVLVPALLLAANGKPDVRHAVGRMNATSTIGMGLNRLTDFDGDGYSWFSALRDPAPFDGTRYPLALDIPGNGVDEDGIGGDLNLLEADSAPALPPLPKRPRHLVLIVLESTRGDVIGKRVNGKVVAPNLEALAQAGSMAPEAYSHVGFTTASLKSLFSGQYEPRVGAPSLFRDLKAAGYRIGVFSGQPEDFGDISQVTGMRATSDVFADAETLKADRAFGFAAQGSLLVDEAKLLAQFDQRIGAKGWQQPTFLYFNFQSPHFPYHHPGMVDRIEPNPLPRDQIDAAHRAALAPTYWNAVAYSDARIGDVIARLKALGVWQDTLLVVTADHGESLFEDGFLGHGHRINRTQTHIPLVISEPGVDLSAPMGLSDYRGLLRRVLAGDRAGVRRRAPVLRYIGTLDAPAAIGMVQPGGLSTSFDLENQTVWFEERGLHQDYAALPPGSADRARADLLLRAWGSARWRQHQGH
ncbi:sulfatase-like hydrolase/transferase [Sphingomonas sp. S2-65]|uniref:sulfatase-like hydrolase/transferase n=1 Tax=Sphingomonas sp. S2-65 TaxID=2903960 RepID=UPI001F36416A|nr:sulfatase-like hydrolase/transferase [Sphingomonas sp. S2-65]UYY58298.1 sulfatase-like hydrolase/transferase [Sphingomonas sp. S2-65]